MKRQFWLLVAGTGLIVLSNAVVLIGVAYNRSGEPRATLTLSERELAPPYKYGSMNENSGLSLHLKWRSNAMYSPTRFTFMDNHAAWLNRDKLAQLGFDVSESPRDKLAMQHYLRRLPRKVYIAFEFNGPAYQEILKQSREYLDNAKASLAKDPGNQLLIRQVKFATKALDDAMHYGSRLIAVDAGLESDELRRRYPDHSHYLILPGVVNIAVLNKELRGFITGLGGSSVNVPLAYRRAFVPAAGAKRAHYTVRVAYGKRFEPWLLDAKAVRDDQPGE